KDDEQAINVCLDFFGAALIPCPDFWRNVIERLNTKWFGKLCNTSIEAAVINQDHDIRFEFYNVVLAKLEHAPDGAIVGDEFNKTHKRQLLVVNGKFNTG